MPKVRRFAVVVAAACAPFGCIAVVDFDGYKPAPPDTIVVAPDATPPPTHAATSLAFTDQDPSAGFVAGPVLIGRATDESDVTSYDLYWTAPAADGGTTRLQRIAVLRPDADAGSTLSFVLASGSVIPATATGLTVVTAHDDVEMSTGPTLDYTDNKPRESDLSVGHVATTEAGLAVCPGPGCTPAAVVDPFASKLLAVTVDGANNNRLALFRCELDGTGCSYTDISTGAPDDSGHKPTAIVDSVGHKLLVASQDGALSGSWGIERCELDGTSCTHTDMTGQVAGKSPALLFDEASQKLLVVVETTNQDRPALLRCSPDLTACDPPTDISLQKGFTELIARIDGTNRKLLVTAKGIGATPRLLRCALDGTGCTYLDVSVSGAQPAAVLWDMAVDPVGQKLLFALPQQVFRCELDGSACTLANAPYGSLADLVVGVESAHLLVDVKHQKLLVVFMPGSTTRTFGVALARCALDGTGCQQFRLSHEPDTLLVDPFAVLDPTGQRVLIVSDNTAAGDRPWLSWIATW